VHRQEALHRVRDTYPSLRHPGDPKRLRQFVNVLRPAEGSPGVRYGNPLGRVDPHRDRAGLPRLVDPAGHGVTCHHDALAGEIIGLLPHHICRPLRGLVVSAREEMRVGHRRHCHIAARVERIDTLGDLELFDRAIRVSKINPGPTHPCSCEHQIGIELDGAGKEFGGHLDLADDVTEREPSHPEHARIVPVEFDRPRRQPPGFGNFIRNIRAPAKGLSLREADGRQRIRQGETGIDRARRPREFERFKVRFAREAVAAGERPKIIIVGFKASGRLALRALDFGALEMRKNSTDHA
jgi:hypothetical protein